MNKFREVVLEDMASTFAAIIAYNKPPSVKDVEFATFVMTIYMLNLCGVKLDSDRPEIQDALPEIKDLFQAINKLQLKIDESANANENLEQLLKFAMNSKSATNNKA